jgi:hypothetical protein
MIESTINGIFPTPVYISKLDRDLSKKELLFIDKIKLNTYNNEGDNTRISLAFNVFIKGTVGNNKNLTELIL